MCQRLLHDTAWAGATAICEIFAPGLTREEEQREAFAMAYDVCKAMLEAYQIQSNREAARLLKPSSN
jgi:hypothetical protein